MTEDQEDRAKLVCLRLLSYRARSRAELKTRLEAKGFPPVIIRRTLADLIRLGLVNDEEVARQGVEGRMRFRPSGAAVLRRELAKKGIDSQLAAETVAQLLGEEEEWQLALGLAQARLRRSHFAKEKWQARLGRFLAGRGFSYSIIRKVLNICAQETTDTL
jgi:regulatory protein